MINKKIKIIILITYGLLSKINVFKIYKNSLFNCRCYFHRRIRLFLAIIHQRTNWVALKTLTVPGRASEFRTDFPPCISVCFFITKILVNSILIDFLSSVIKFFMILNKANCHVTNTRKQFNKLDELPTYDRSLVDYAKYNQRIGHAGVKYSMAVQATQEDVPIDVFIVMFIKQHCIIIGDQ